MKPLIAAAIVALLMAVPAFASDGHVPSSTLASLGLGDLQVLTENEGLEVRGRSASAMSMGQSLVTGVIVDPATKSFIFGTDTNAAMSTAENAGLQILTAASHAQASSVALNLTVTSAQGTFVGSLSGVAGGSGLAFGQ